MKYVIFDIDGTLTNTTNIDDHCFAKALEDVFGFTGFETDWGHYTHTTDSGIIQQLFAERHHREPTKEEINLFITRFCALLQDWYNRDNSAITQMPGAARALQNLAALPGYAIGLATGGWQQSARFKLSCAGIEGNHLTSSFAQDAVARKDIISSTVAKLNAITGHQPAPADITYVGDGLWDYRAADELGIGFLGIRNPKLEHLNNIRFVDDYNQLAAVV